MDLSFKTKDALNHFKGRKFLCFAMVFVIVIVWALIGMNSVKASDTETLTVWLTTSSDSTDNIDIEEITEQFEKKHKEWGFKEYTSLGGAVSSNDDKITFNLWHTSVDFYIMPKKLIEEFHTKFIDLSLLGFEKSDFSKNLFIYENKAEDGETVVKEEVLGIYLGKDYVFAVSESATIPEGSLQSIIDFVNAFTFTVNE